MTRFEPSPAAKIGIAIAAVVQLCLAFFAFWDLAHRQPTEVRGRKPVWIPIILVNWVGPISYFAFGIRRPARTSAASRAGS